MAAACQSKLSRFFFVVFWCFLAFLPRITLLCLFQKKKTKKNNLLNVCNGIWNICSMILYIYIFKSTDTLSQILYRGPLLCWLFYFCEKNTKNLARVIKCKKGARKEGLHSSEKAASLRSSLLLACLFIALSHPCHFYLRLPYSHPSLFPAKSSGVFLLSRLPPPSYV